MNDQDYFSPSRIKASPTGRVPKWVVDEAMGRPVDVVPFRGATVGLPAPSTPLDRRRRWPRSILIGVAVVAVCAVSLKLRAPATVGGLIPVARNGQAPSGPPAGHEERSSGLGAPPAVTALPEGSGFRFLSHQQDRTTPVTWSPCRPIHYVTRPVGQPALGGELISAAVAEVSRATGLQFIDDGTTEEGPSTDRPLYQPERYGQRWAPVLIAWASAAEVPDFGVDIAGEAGAAAIRTPSGDSTFVSGVVYLDPVKMSAIAAGQGFDVARVVVMHELGHLVGLAHIDDPQQVMFPRSSARATMFSAGDAAGLARLGQGACQPDA